MPHKKSGYMYNILFMGYHYTHDDILLLADRIEQLQDRQDYSNIFQIISRDRRNRYTRAANDVILDLSLLSDKTLRRVKRYLDEEVKWPDDTIQLQLEVDASEARMYKLSNYERSILKYNQTQAD